MNWKYCPTSYIVFRLCILGLDDDKLATWFGIDPITFGYWYYNNTGIRMAFDKGREIADRKMMNTLYQTMLKRTK